MEKSQLEFNYLLQPDDVRAANDCPQQQQQQQQQQLQQLSSVNGNVLRGAACTNDLIIQRA